MSQMFVSTHSDSTKGLTEGVNLFCFPFAGGNAYSYRPLEKLMHSAIRVLPLEPPGRGRRSKEQPLKSMHEIALDMVECIRSLLGKPFAFFGHSMGGLTAYLVTCQLLREDLPLPLHLFISGKGPPHRISREAQWYTLPLEDFKQKLATMGGSAPAVLNDRELMAYFAPIIQDDMRVIAEYNYIPAPPFDVPITALIGTTENITKIEASEWGCMTASDFRLIEYEGGHFFLFDHLEDICALVHSSLVTH